jgi:hypothetical protein
MTRIKLLRPHNTDGIINKLVKVFAPLRRDLASPSSPEFSPQGGGSVRRYLLNFCSCSLDRFVMAYTSTAPVPAKTMYTLTCYLLPINLVPPLSLRSDGAQRDTRIAHKIYTRTAKSAPYPPFPANDKFQPDSGNLLWPELRREHNLPILPGRYASWIDYQVNDNLTQ